MSDIFISYKREEQPQAKALAEALERQGWSVWWDPKLRAGEHFDEVIERALRETKCVIVMWSKRSVESRYVRNEATYALTRGKLVPVAIEDVSPPFRFEGIQTVSLSGWDGSDTFPGFQKLVRDLKPFFRAPPPPPPKQPRLEQLKAWFLNNKWIAAAVLLASVITGLLLIIQTVNSGFVIRGSILTKGMPTGTGIIGVKVLWFNEKENELPIQSPEVGFVNSASGRLEYELKLRPPHSSCLIHKSGPGVYALGKIIAFLDTGHDGTLHAGVDQVIAVSSERVRYVLWWFHNGLLPDDVKSSGYTILRYEKPIMSSGFIWVAYQKPPPVDLEVDSRAHSKLQHEMQTLLGERGLTPASGHEFDSPSPSGQGGGIDRLPSRLKPKK